MQATTMLSHSAVTRHCALNVDTVGVEIAREALQVTSGPSSNPEGICSQADCLRVKEVLLAWYVMDRQVQHDFESHATSVALAPTLPVTSVWSGNRTHVTCAANRAFYH